MSSLAQAQVERKPRQKKKTDRKQAKRSFQRKLHHIYSVSISFSFSSRGSARVLQLWVSTKLVHCTSHMRLSDMIAMLRHRNPSVGHSCWLIFSSGFAYLQVQTNDYFQLNLHSSYSNQGAKVWSSTEPSGLP